MGKPIMLRDLTSQHTVDEPLDAQIQARVPARLLSAMVARAAVLGISVSGLTRRILMEALETE